MCIYRFAFFLECYETQKPVIRLSLRSFILITLTQAPYLIHTLHNTITSDPWSYLSNQSLLSTFSSHISPVTPLRQRPSRSSSLHHEMWLIFNRDHEFVRCSLGLSIEVHKLVIILQTTVNISTVTLPTLYSTSSSVYWYTYRFLGLSCDRTEKGQ